jgi:hypothetical protein
MVIALEVRALEVIAARLFIGELGGVVFKVKV